MNFEYNYNFERDGIRVVCDCGSVLYFGKRTETLICRWCGNKVFRDDKAKFKDNLRKEMNKQKRNEGNNAIYN